MHLSVCTKNPDMKVTLDKSLGGLGLSITGGSDNQVKANNSNIYITKVTLVLWHTPRVTLNATPRLCPMEWPIQMGSFALVIYYWKSMARQLQMVAIRKD